MVGTVTVAAEAWVEAESGGAAPAGINRLIIRFYPKQFIKEVKICIERVFKTYADYPEILKHLSIENFENSHSNQF